MGDIDSTMSKRQEAPGGQELVHNGNNGSRNQRYTKPNRNLTWTRNSLARDHTTKFPTAVDPAARCSATNPAARHSYRYGAHESPQYGHGPAYHQNVYRPHGVRSCGYGTHFHPSPGFQAHYPHNSRDSYRSYGSRDYYPPSHGSGDHYPPSHGSSDYYTPSHGSSPHYPLQRVGASGPRSYGVRAPGNLSYSHGVAAANHPSHGKEVHGFPSYEAGAIVPSLMFPAVSMRGLPRNCTEVDIIRFFDGLDVVDVFLVFNNKIFSRKAFVIFPNPEALGSALQRDKQKFGDAFADISTCRRNDYYDAVAAAVNDGMDFGNPLDGKDNNVVVDVNFHEGPQGQSARFEDSSVVRDRDIADSKLHRHPDGQPGNLLESDQEKPTRRILKVRGRPCSVDKKVILDVFGECNLSEDRVRNVFHADGKPTGEMLLEFNSQEDAKKAMSMYKTMTESHLTEIVPCREDLQMTNTKQRHKRDSQDMATDFDDKELMGPGAHSHSKPRSYNDKEHKVYTRILKLGNVPPSADIHDIIDFFSEFKLNLERLQVVCRRDGIATGEVFVEFESVEDAKKAISKGKKLILSQCVELFPSSPDEASQAMSGSW